MSSRQAAPQLGWAVCSGEWHVRAGECLQHDTGSIFLFDWLTHSLQKPQKVLDLESRSYVSYGKLPFHMVFVSDLNRYRLSRTHSYARSFLFPSNFSCFYFLLFFSFYPRGWGREVTGCGQALNTQAGDHGCLLSSPTCAFCDTMYSLSKPEVSYPSFRYFAASGRTLI